MAFSLGFSDSDSSSESNFNQEISPDQLPYLKDMWSSMGNLWQMGMPFMLPMMSGGGGNMDKFMSMMEPFWKQSMEGGVYGDMNNPELYKTAMGNLMNPTTYKKDLYEQIMGGEGNDYVDAYGGAISQQYSDVLDRNLAKLDQRSGLMSGSSGWENAMGKIISESGKDEAATLSKLGFDTFDQDLMNKLDIAGLADTNWLESAKYAVDSSGGMVDKEQQTKFGGLDFGGDMWNSGMTQFMLPWTMMMMYGSMMNPTTLTSGSSTSSGDSSGFGFGF